MFVELMKNSSKVFVIYCVSTIIAMVVTPLFVKNGYSIEQYKNYLIPFTVFTIVFIILNTKYKTNKIILISSFILVFFLVSMLLITDIFSISGLTPNNIENVFVNLGTTVGLYTTIPYQMLIYILVGYSLEQYVYIIFAIYLISTISIIYVVDKLKIKKLKINKNTVEN